jgi:hypothetical protein
MVYLKKNTKKFVSILFLVFCEKNLGIFSTIILMVVNGSKKNAENPPELYKCTLCDFECSKKSNYDKHLRTLKHQRNQNGSKKMPKNAEICPWSCICGRSYKYESGYYRHIKVCLISSSEEKVDKDIVEEEEVDYKSLFLNMIHENKELRSQITELIPKVGSNNNNNTINNKQRFNINIFLNEECKDALTMTEFIEKIKVTLDNLTVTKDKGLTEGVSNIFIENMNKLSLRERPMHCTDAKRETVYIKSGESSKDGGWKRDEENKELKNALLKVSKVQQQNLEKWTKEHPNWMENSELQKEYMALVKNCTDDLRENKREEKAVKKVCNKVYLGDVMDM